MKGMLFTYAMAYGGAYVALYRPFYGLLIYISFAIIRPGAMWFWSVETFNYSRVVAIGLLVGWAIHGFGNWKFGRARDIAIALAAFWIWTVATVLVADLAGPAQKYAEVLTKIVVPFVVGLTLIDSVQKLMQLAWCIMLSEAYVAAEMNLSYFTGFNRAYNSLFDLLDNNGLAATMVCGTWFALFLALESRNRWLKGICLLSALLMVHTVLLTFSRGGMLGLVVSALTAFLIMPKKPGYLALFFVAVAVSIQLAGPEVRSRFASVFDRDEIDESSEMRLKLWNLCLASSVQEPLGLGPDQFRYTTHRHGFDYGRGAHTTWLQILAEQGVPGFVTLILFYGLCWQRLLPLSMPSAQVLPKIRALSRMVVAILPGFAVSAQFVSLPLVEIPYYSVLVGAGALKVYSEWSSPASEKPPRTGSRSAAVGDRIEVVHATTPDSSRRAPLARPRSLSIGS
jgi:putative inorganic carbon (hco3(-)) transporter